MDWLLPLLAGLLILVGTAMGLFITYSFRNQTKNKQEEIKKLNRDIDFAVKSNKDLTKKVLEISNKLNEVTSEIKDLVEKTNLQTDKNLELTEKTIRLSEKLENIATGGDGFCVIEFAYINSNSTRPFVIYNGKYPLYDVHIRIVDLELFRQLKDLTVESINQAQHTFYLGNLKPNTATPLGKIFADFSGAKKDFNIFYSGRNGFHTQTTRLRKVEKKWFSKIRVWITNSNDILYEQTDENFPIDDLE